MKKKKPESSPQREKLFLPKITQQIKTPAVKRRLQKIIMISFYLRIQNPFQIVLCIEKIKDCFHSFLSDSFITRVSLITAIEFPAGQRPIFRTFSVSSIAFLCTRSTTFKSKPNVTCKNFVVWSES